MEKLNTAEYYESISVTPDVIERIIGALVRPSHEEKSLRQEADLLIEDAIERRTIAKAQNAFEERVAEENPQL